MPPAVGDCKGRAEDVLQGWLCLENLSSGSAAVPGVCSLELDMTVYLCKALRAVRNELPVVKLLEGAWGQH